jgi:hypothetical protein
VSAVAVFWIVVAAACCGLCVYGISRAIRRSKERQTEEQSVRRTDAYAKPPAGPGTRPEVQRPG